VKSSASTATEFLAEQPEDRRRALTALRDLIRRNLPKGYEEGMAWGCLTWSVPLAACPDTYNGQPLMYCGIGSQKHYMGLYLMGIYTDPALDRTFRAAFAKAGKKLDCGKSCVRFRKLEDLHLPAVADVIAAIPVKEYVRRAQAAQAPKARKSAPAGAAKPRVAANATAMRKAGRREPARARVR
jgi:hypothetical protein